MEKKIYKSAELFEAMRKLTISAKESVKAFMVEHNIIKFDCTQDLEGKTYEDDDYDEDWVWENRVWTECYGKYGNETGYITHVRLYDDRGVTFEAEGEDNTYPFDFCDQSLSVWVSILERMELQYRD